MTNKIQFHAGDFAGQFKFTKVNDTGVVTGETEWIPNLITNFYLDYVCSANSRNFENGSFLAVGSGNTAPAATDVALVSQIGSRTNNTTGAAILANSGSPLYYSSWTKTWEFPLGAIVGNVAEVGVFTSASGSNAFTRALVRDGAGNPTTFSVLSNETLFVTYEVRFYPNLSDVSGTISISSVSYDYTMRASRADGATGNGLSSNVRGHSANGNAAAAYSTQTLPAVTASPAGTSFGTTSYSYDTYTSGTFTFRETLTWGPTEGNISGGIGLITFGKNSATSTSVNGGWNMSFNPKIPKLNTHTLTLTFDITYGRHTP